MARRYRRTQNDGAAFDRPDVVGDGAIGTVSVGIVVLRVPHTHHVLPAQELPVPVELPAVKAVVILDRQVGAEEWGGLVLRGNPAHAAQVGDESPTVVGATRVEIAVHDERRAANVERIEEGGVSL